MKLAEIAKLLNANSFTSLNLNDIETESAWLYAMMSSLY